MNILWGFLLTLAVAAAAIAAMLLVRRRAPEGGYFADGDRAAGVFGVLATGFSVLLGFIVFLAFTSYDESRSGAETEALMVAQQVQTAQFFPASASAELTGELVCYGRSVVGDEWERMQAGTLGDAINPWGVELFETVRKVEPQTASEQSAYDKWLEQTSTREAARQDRVHGAVGVIPIQLWIVLFFIAAGDLRLHAVLRRQRRARSRPVADDRVGGRGDRDDAAAAERARQPVPGRRRRPRPGRDGAHAAHRGRVAPRHRRRRSRCPAAPTAPRFREGRRAARGRRHRPALARNGRDGVERLPGEPLERRAGEVVQPCIDLARCVHQGGRPRERADADRRRDLHPVGRRVRARPDASSPTSTSPASARSSSRRSTPGSRRGRDGTPTRR